MNGTQIAVRLRKILVFTILVLHISGAVTAQNKLNFGLRTKQDSATLPHSKSTIRFPERKAQTLPRTVLSPVNSGEWILSGGWMLAEANLLVTSEKSIFNAGF